MTPSTPVRWGQQLWYARIICIWVDALGCKILAGKSQEKNSVGSGMVIKTEQVFIPWEQCGRNKEDSHLRMTQTTYYEIQNYLGWLWDKIDTCGYSFYVHPPPFLEVTGQCAWTSPLSQVNWLYVKPVFKTCLKTLLSNKIDFLQKQSSRSRRNQKQVEVHITEWTKSRQNCSSENGVVSLLYGDFRVRI